jgi:hypothetical protein
MVLGGCILPVGPEFQDPAPVPNQPPYFVSGAGAVPFPQSSQAVGAIPFTFTVVAGDSNLSDTLTAKWVSNYPPYNANSRLLSTQETNGVDRATQPDVTFSWSVTCSDFPPAAENSLAVIVSDRGFLDAIPASAIDPQHPYNFDSSGHAILVMTGWRITGCQ